MSWTRVKGVENEGPLKTISHQPDICPLSPLLSVFHPDPERDPRLHNNNLMKFYILSVSMNVNLDT